MKNRRNRRRFWTAAGVLCFLAAAVMAGMAGRTWISYQNSEKGLQELYRQMEEISAAAKTVPQETVSVTDQTDEYFENVAHRQQTSGAGENVGTSETGDGTIDAQLSYDVLKDQNPDMAGWIQIPGTVVNYPVMHTPQDPDYYFHRDFYGRESSYGMIYIDGSCIVGESPNLVLYGHHMRNGAMFASIGKYESASYWKRNPQILFDAQDHQGSYEVMAAFRVSADEINEEFLKMLAASTEQDYIQLMQYLQTNAVYPTGVTSEWPRQLITLTTCEYSQKNGRFLVVAREKETR